MEYKYCPNLTIIDTPGLISAAPGPGKKSSVLQGFSAQVRGCLVVHSNTYFGLGCPSVPV